MAGARKRLTGFEKLSDVAHRLAHGRVLVVAGDRVVQRLPQPLDDIHLQYALKHQFELRIARQTAPGDAALVNDVIVGNEHDTPSLAVGTIMNEYHSPHPFPLRPAQVSVESAMPYPGMQVHGEDGALPPGGVGAEPPAWQGSARKFALERGMGVFGVPTSTARQFQHLPAVIGDGSSPSARLRPGAGMLVISTRIFPTEPPFRAGISFSSSPRQPLRGLRTATYRMISGPLQ